MSESPTSYNRFSSQIMGNPLLWLLVTILVIAIAWVWMSQNTTQVVSEPVKKLSPDSATANLDNIEDIIKQESLEITNENDASRADEFLMIEETENKTIPLFAAAERNMDLGQYVTPPGNNAWENYQEILGLVPDNTRASAGLTRIRNLLIDNAEIALESGDFGEVENWLTQLDVIEPGGAIQADMRRSVEQEIKALALARQKEQEAQERAEKITTTLEQAAEELARQNPNLDMARDLYSRVLELDPGNEQAIAGLQDIVDDILDQAETALRVGNLEQTEEKLGVARRMDPDNKRLSSIGLALESRIAQQESESQLQASQESEESTDSPTADTEDMAAQDGSDAIDDVVANLDDPAVEDSVPQPTLPSTDSTVVEDVTAEEIALKQREMKLQEGIQAYYTGNYNRSFEILYPLAEAGMPRAQFRIGVMYRYGRSVAENPDLSERWFNRALPAILQLAQRGQAWAQTDLGTAYELGISLKQDFQRAAYWYRQAADQGYAGAQTNLGVLYANGEGVSYSRQEAVYWLKQAAEQGDLVAIENLRIMGVTL